MIGHNQISENSRATSGGISLDEMHPDVLKRTFYRVFGSFVDKIKCEKKL